MESTLKNRLMLGPLMLAGLALALWFDWAVEHWTTPADGGEGIKGLGLMLVLLPVLPLGTLELGRIFAVKRVQPYRSIAAVGISLLIVHAFCTQFDAFKKVSASTLAFIVIFVMLFAALRRASAGKSTDAIVSMAGTVLATLYLGGLGWFLLALRVKTGALFDGTTMHIVMILLTVKFTDIGAFFTGKAIGRHKLIPWLSPGKTWEGLIGGLLTASVVGAALSPFIHEIPWGEGAAVGLVVGGIGQLGDLLESMMKRDAEVKDSGQLIPGFGGVLDVIDSPLLAAPFAYLLFSLL